MCVFHCPNIPLKTKAYTDLRIRSHLRTYYHFCYCELETIYRLGNASTTLYIRSYRYMYVKDWQLLIDIYFYFCPLSSFDSQKCHKNLFVMFRLSKMPKGFVRHVLIYPFAQSLYNGWSIRALQSSRIYANCSIKNQDLRSNYKLICISSSINCSNFIGCPRETSSSIVGWE